MDTPTTPATATTGRRSAVVRWLVVPTLTIGMVAVTAAGASASVLGPKAPRSGGGPLAGDKHLPSAVSKPHVMRADGQLGRVGLPNLAPRNREPGPDASNAYSTDYMVYNGGPVQSAPRLHLVLWGDWSNGDPYGEASQLDGFLRGVGGSNWAAVMTQYQNDCVVGTYSCPLNVSGFTNPADEYVGAWNDTSPVPDTPTVADIDAEAQRAAAQIGDTDLNAQYIIALPSGHGDGDFVTKGGGACAWHNDASTGASTWISVTDLPYMPDAGQACGNYSVNNSILDGATIVESHEYAESVTDPGLNAWFDSAGGTGENGDKCAWVSQANTDFATGTYPVQPTWSNYARETVGDGCAYSA